MIVILLEILLMVHMSRSMQHSYVRVMIHTPILITRGGEIIQTSHGRLKLQITQVQGCTNKLNLAGHPTNLLPHTCLYNNSLRPYHLLGRILTFKIRC